MQGNDERQTYRLFHPAAAEATLLASVMRPPRPFLKWLLNSGTLGVGQMRLR